MIARLLTTGEVAEWLGIAEKTVVDLRYKRKGPPFVKVGRAVRYDPAAVDQWLQENSYGGRP